MTQRKRKPPPLLPGGPEERIRKGLPALCRIWENKENIYLKIWWGREQAAGTRLIEISQLFPWPDPIPKGGGIFEEILYLLRNIEELEIYTVGEKEGKEFSDFKQAIGRIRESSVSAIITALSYTGSHPDFWEANTCAIKFQKEKPAV